MTGASIVGFLIGNSDYVIVGHSLGATSLGLYLLAYNIAGWPISVLTGIVGGVAMPAFVRVQHDAKRLSHSAANALSLLASIAFPVSALLFALAEPLVICVYGSKWSGAVIALRALALFGALRVPIDLFNSVLTASGRTRALLSIQIGWLVALLPLLIVGVDRYGIEGAGLAHVVVSALVVLPAYLLILRRAGVQSRPLAGAVVRPAIASLVAGAAAYAIAGSGSSWTVLMVGGSAGAGAYLLVVGPWIRRVINQARRALGIASRRSRAGPRIGGCGMTVSNLSASESSPTRGRRVRAERLEGKPSVSVVVPCFNYGHFLGDSVGSALAQQGVDVDVLIVDDCSTDGSDEIAASFARRDAARSGSSSTRRTRDTSTRSMRVCSRSTASMS